MTEYRCKFCHRLLFKYNPDTNDFEGEGYSEDGYKKHLRNSAIECKCPKCNKITKILVHDLL